MDGVRQFLEAVRQADLHVGRLRGLLHVVIGRSITGPDGKPVSRGVTWRELSGALRQLRWDRTQVAELGLDPDALPPRDRQRFWYAAITKAAVDSPAARAAGDELAALVTRIGYTVGPAPGD